MSPVFASVESDARAFAELHTVTNSSVASKGKVMLTNTANLSLDEVGERADAYYDSVLRAQVETPENTGKYLLLDTTTGRYVIGTDRLALARSLAATTPEAVCTLRIGYPATTTIGGDLRPLSEMTPEQIAQMRQRVRRSDRKA